MNVLFKLGDKIYTLGSRRNGGVCGGGGGGGEIVSLCYAQSYFPLNTFNHIGNV
jgi:hypothetical protein